MSVRSKPNYGIYVFDLSAAGSRDMPVPGTRVALVTALLGATFINVAGQSIVAGGTVAPSALVNVLVGKSLGDPIPFSINTKISVEETFEFLRLSWAAQPGVTAFFMIDDDRGGAGVFVDSPSPILGGAISVNVPGTISPAQAVVTNVAGGVVLSAFSGTKQRTTIRNKDATNSVWIGKGDGTLTNANGFELQPGEPPLVITGTEAINGISNVAGGVAVDVIVEQ
jgi:hypothetical protein